MKFEELNLLDIGNTMEISGVVYENDTDAIVIYLPNTVDPVKLHEMFPTLEQWQQIVRQSDIKEISGMDKDKKIILRKSTRQIETSVMWEVFRRDKFTCRYCDADEVPLTVDHVVLWEDGGPSIPMNLITSCKKCNNKRGNTRYEDWIVCSYYMSNVDKLPYYIVKQNRAVLHDIPEIIKNYLRTSKRSR